MSIVTIVKPYEELTTDELYRVIQLRIQGFIVRNQVCYQDLEAHYDKNQYYMMSYDTVLGIEPQLMIGVNALCTNKVFTGDDGVGRNSRYFSLLNNFGVNLEADADGNFPLSLLEESDVVGKPILAKLDSETYEKDGEERTAWKVSNVQPWADGQQLSVEEIEEDLPF